MKCSKTYANKDVSGGLYVYSVEEFGKPLLFRNVPSLNGRRKVKYDREFVKHEKKIEAAFNYFRMNNFHPCLISARACGQTSDVEDVEWRDVVVDLPADTEARLSIFYSDFVYDSNQNPVIEGLPDADPKMLQKTTEQLEVATKGLPI